MQYQEKTTKIQDHIEAIPGTNHDLNYYFADPNWILDCERGRVAGSTSASHKILYFRPLQTPAKEGEKTTLYILNTPVLTNYGTWEYTPITIEEAKVLLNMHNFKSAIGHESTSIVLSTLLDHEIKYNRIKIKMYPGDHAIVFQLNTRIPEGKILSIKEIENIGYKLGWLKNIDYRTIDDNAPAEELQIYA